MNPAYVHINKESEADKKCKLKQLFDKNVYSIEKVIGNTVPIEDNIIEARSLAAIQIMNKSKLLTIIVPVYNIINY